MVKGNYVEEPTVSGVEEILKEDGIYDYWRELADNLGSGVVLQVDGTARSIDLNIPSDVGEDEVKHFESLRRKVVDGLSGSIIKYTEPNTRHGFSLDGEGNLKLTRFV